MPVYNIEQHLGCVYYATNDNALFKRYRLSGGDDISGINENRSALLYLAEGALRVDLGSFKSELIESPRLMFLPKNIDFAARSVDGCCVVACFFEGKIPLCNKYNLIDLQHDVTFGNGKIPPPLESLNLLHVRSLYRFMGRCVITLRRG